MLSFSVLLKLRAAKGEHGYLVSCCASALCEPRAVRPFRTIPASARPFSGILSSCPHTPAVMRIQSCRHAHTILSSCAYNPVVVRIRSCRHARHRPGITPSSGLRRGRRWRRSSCGGRPRRPSLPSRRQAQGRIPTST